MLRLKFYAIRGMLGLVTAACEMYFIGAAAKTFGSRVAFYLFVFLAFSTGKREALPACASV